MAEYVDYSTQCAYESGIRDALEEREPWEPSAEDREWFDQQVIRSEPDYTRDEIEQFQRDELSSALDWFWNGPRY